MITTHFYIVAGYGQYHTQATSLLCLHIHNTYPKKNTLQLEPEWPINVSLIRLRVILTLLLKIILDASVFLLHKEIDISSEKTNPPLMKKMFILWIVPVFNYDITIESVHFIVNCRYQFKPRECLLLKIIKHIQKKIDVHLLGTMINLSTKL